MQPSTSFRITDILGVASEGSSQNSSSSEEKVELHNLKQSTKSHENTRKYKNDEVRSTPDEQSEESAHQLSAINFAVHNILSSASKRDFPGLSLYIFFCNLPFVFVSVAILDYSKAKFSEF